MSIESIILNPLFLIMYFTVYFTPSMIASVRDHEHRNAVFFVNTLGGWFPPLFVYMLVWAIWGDRRKTK